MNIFLRLLNRIRFKDVELIGEVQNQFNGESKKVKNFEYFKATPKTKKATGFTLLLNGKVLQNNVDQVCAQFTASEKLKPFSNAYKFATKSGTSAKLYDVNGYCITPLGPTPRGKYYDISSITSINSAFQIKGLMGTSFFINFDNNFISEEYSSVEKAIDGTFKVVSRDTGKTYCLSSELLPIEETLTLEDAISEETQDQMELEAIQESEPKTETLFGHTIVTKKNGERRFIDENGKNRSFPIDKIVDLQNGTILIKRNHSSNWDIQRMDNLKFVVKAIKNCIHNSDTHLTFGYYEDKPVIFGTDPSKMYQVDESTAKLVLNLLNKTKMSSTLINHVESNPKEMDATLKVFQSVLLQNLESDKNNKTLRRLTGRISLDRRFVNHLIGIYKAREKRESKTITDIERQIKFFEDQITMLSENLETAKDKKGIASESYSSILEIKGRLEQKLKELEESKSEKGDEE